MVLMSIFCFVCSIRLSAILIGCVSVLEALIPTVLLFALGSEYLKECAANIQLNHQNYYTQLIFDHTLQYLENDSFTFVVGFSIFLSIYLLTCLLLIYGTLKLNKWMLLPYIFMELIRLLIVSTVHIVGMMVIKKQMNLGVLITVTITGGFGLLLLFYMWSCIIALFQIISIINTQNYKQLYGERNSLSKSTDKKILFNRKSNNTPKLIENVQVFPLSDIKKQSQLKHELNTDYLNKKYYNKNNYNNKNAYNTTNNNKMIYGSGLDYDSTIKENMLNNDFNELQSREFFNYSNNRYKFNNRY